MDEQEIYRRLNKGEESFFAVLVSALAQGLQLPAEVVQGRSDITHAAEFAVELAERGWAPSGLVPVPGYVRVAAMRLSGDELDDAIADVWDATEMLPGVLARFGGLGAGIDEGILAASAARVEVISAAWELHVQGCYEATVPMVLAQADGVCFDASGLPLFSKAPGSPMLKLVDEVTFAGAQAALGVVRDLFNRDQPHSVASGELRRHAILHGRELAYGTRANSWKCFVFLLAIWEWATVHLRERAEQRARVGASRWAGSDEVDAQRRARDRRGFYEARLALRDVAAAQTGYHRDTGSFGTLDQIRDRAAALSFRQDLTSRVTIAHADRDRWWAWSRAPSGRVFAIGAVGDAGLWRFWDGLEIPLSGPDDWPTREPPNWESSTVPGRGDPLPGP